MGFWYYCLPKCCGAPAYRNWPPLRGTPNFIDRQGEWVSLTNAASTGRFGGGADMYRTFGIQPDGSLWMAEGSDNALRFVDSGPWASVRSDSGASRPFLGLIGIKTDGTMWTTQNISGTGVAWDWSGVSAAADSVWTSGQVRTRISCTIESFQSNGSTIGAENLSVTLGSNYDLNPGGSHAEYTHAMQNGRVFFVRVTSGGSGYTKPPVVSFSPPGAIATAVVVGGVVTFIRVESGGGAYSQIPTVTITPSAGGSGCAATAYVEGQARVTVTDGGDGYTNPPPGMRPPLLYTFMGTCSNSASGMLYEVSLTNKGSGYVGPLAPGVTITGRGAGASATASVNADGEVVSVSVADGGEGYCEPFAPDVTITGQGQYAAAAASVDSLGFVRSVRIINPGRGYADGTTSVSLSPARDGLSGVVRVQGGRIDSIEISGQTEPYLRPVTPKVSFAPEGAMATATVRASHPFDVVSIAVNSGGSGYFGPLPPAVSLLPNNPHSGDAAVVRAVVHAGGSVSSLYIESAGSGYTDHVEFPLSFTSQIAGKGSGAAGTARCVSPYRWRAEGASFPIPVGIAVLSLGTLASVAVDPSIPIAGGDIVPAWAIDGSSGELTDLNFTHSLPSDSLWSIVNDADGYVHDDNNPSPPTATADGGWDIGVTVTATNAYRISSGLDDKRYAYRVSVNRSVSEFDGKAPEISLSNGGKVQTGWSTERTGVLTIVHPLFGDAVEAVPSESSYQWFGPHLTNSPFGYRTSVLTFDNPVVGVKVPPYALMKITTVNLGSPTFGNNLAPDGDCPHVPFFDDNGVLREVGVEVRLPSIATKATLMPHLLEQGALAIEDGVLRVNYNSHAPPFGEFNRLPFTFPDVMWVSPPQPGDTTETQARVYPTGTYRPAVAPLGTEASVVPTHQTRAVDQIIPAKASAVLQAVDDVAHVTGFIVDDPGYGYEYEPRIEYSYATQSDGVYTTEDGRFRLVQVPGSGWTDAIVQDHFGTFLCGGIRGGDLYVWGSSVVYSQFTNPWSGWGSNWITSPTLVPTIGMQGQPEKFISADNQFAGITMDALFPLSYMEVLAGGKVWRLNTGDVERSLGHSGESVAEVVVGEVTTVVYGPQVANSLFSLSDTVTTKQQISNSTDLYIVTVEDGGLGYASAPQVSVEYQPPIPLLSYLTSDESATEQCEYGQQTVYTKQFRIADETDVPQVESASVPDVRIDEYGRVRWAGSVVVSVRGGSQPIASVNGECESPATAAVTKINDYRLWPSWAWTIEGRISDTVTSGQESAHVTDKGVRTFLGWLTSSPAGKELDGIEHIADSMGYVSFAGWKSDGSIWYSADATYARIQGELELRVTGENEVGKVFVESGGVFKSAPAVTFYGGGGSGAAGVAVMKGTPEAGYSVSSITVTSAGYGYDYPPFVGFTGGDATSKASAKATLISGCGEGLTLPPRISLSQVSGVPTTDATINGKVVAIGVTDGGSMYSSVPSVTITARDGDTGSGAEGKAHVCMRVVSLPLESAGSGYVHPPSLIFSRPGMPAEGTAVVAGGISGVVITRSGSGYSQPPEVAFVGSGKGASATATIRGCVGAIVVTGGGSGYKSSPTVSISGGGGTGCAAVAMLTGSETSGYTVSGVLITRPGSGYSSPPAVSFSGGDPDSPATANAVLDAGLHSISLASAGDGYTDPTHVSVSGGTGQASAYLSMSVRSASLTSGGRYWNTPPSLVVSARPSVDSISLTSGGSGYQSTPEVLLVGGSGAGATAACKISASVSKVVITAGGLGYTPDFPPWVSLSGGYDLAVGSPASATAAVSQGGAISGISITESGSGYLSPPVVRLRWPEAASAYAEISESGQVSKINVVNKGAFYAAPPRVVLTGGGPNVTKSAAATASVSDGCVQSIAVQDSGAGYTTPPGVSIEYDSYGVDCEAYAVLNGSVSSVTVTGRGYGYEIPPVALFVGGGGDKASASVSTKIFGSGCKITPAVSGSVEYVELTNRGEKYQAPPIVTISAPQGDGGAQATAQARILGRVDSLTNPAAGQKGFFQSPNVLYGRGEFGQEFYLETEDRGYFKVGADGLLEGLGALDFFAANPSVVYEEAIGAVPCARLTPAGYGVDHLDGGTLGETMPTASVSLDYQNGGYVVGGVSVSGLGTVPTTADLRVVISEPPAANGVRATATIAYDEESSSWVATITNPGSGYSSSGASATIYDASSTGYPRPKAASSISLRKTAEWNAWESPYVPSQAWKGHLKTTTVYINTLSATLPYSNQHKPTLVVENEAGTNAVVDITYATTSPSYHTVTISRAKNQEADAGYISRYYPGEPFVSLLNAVSVSQHREPPQVTATVIGQSVASLEVTSQGNWPGVVRAMLYISGGGGQGAKGELSHDNGQWVATLESGGEGYTSSPVVTIVDAAPYAERVKIEASQMGYDHDQDGNAESPQIDGEDARLLFVSQQTPVVPVDCRAIPRATLSGPGGTPIEVHGFYKDGRMVDLWGTHHQTEPFLGNRRADDRNCKAFKHQHSSPPVVTIKCHEGVAPSAFATIVAWLPPETDFSAIRDTSP